MGLLNIGGKATASTSSTSSSGSGSQNQASNTRRLSLDDEEYVRELMRQYGGQATPDTALARKQAIADSTGAIENLFNEFKNSALPDIMSTQQKSGGYGATTTQLIANDAFSNVVAKGAALRLQAIGEYENRALAKSQTALSGLSTSLQSLLQANEQSTANSNYNTRANSKTDSRSITAEASFGF